MQNEDVRGLVDRLQLQHEEADEVEQVQGSLDATGSCLNRSKGQCIDDERAVVSIGLKEITLTGS